MKSPKGNLTKDFFIVYIYVFIIIVFTKPKFLKFVQQDQ